MRVGSDFYGYKSEWISVEVIDDILGEKKIWVKWGRCLNGGYWGRENVMVGSSVRKVDWYCLCRIRVVRLYYWYYFVVYMGLMGFFWVLFLVIFFWYFRSWNVDEDIEEGGLSNEVVVIV